MTEKHGSDPSDLTIVRGTAVVTLDEEELGTVSAIEGDQFKVDVAHGRDFWLDKRTVSFSDERCTTLAYDAEQLEPFKMEAPGATAGSPIVAEQAETFASEEEQAKRRRDMERGHA